ncbi:MAG TPA: PhzF family phenazine biosynthesis protein [Candidatus Krumholzibacteria bacterium]|nr:PhzF family phenazine biosynthesis protein [Candidatus Krumholzibacteria bacterium]
MRYPYWTADVFTDRAFAGNPLAVVADATGLSTEQMQAIAHEFNLSETTFVLPPEEPEHTFRLRIFTPATELEFAGHPTVGSAFVLAHAGRIQLDGDKTRIVFGENVGPVRVDIRAFKGKPVSSQLWVAQLPEVGPPAPESESIAVALGLDPDDVLDDARDHPASLSCGTPYLFVPLRSLAAVRRARVNYEWWNRTMNTRWTQGVFLFSHETEAKEATVQARMFAPVFGIEEDPATGSAAAAFAGYMLRRDGLAEGTARWIIDQGIEMGRPSRMEVEADVADGKVTAVRVAGPSVVISEGHLEV